MIKPNPRFAEMQKIRRKNKRKRLDKLAGLGGRIALNRGIDRDFHHQSIVAE